MSQSPAAAPPPDPLETVRDWMAERHDVALATVVSTWGSAPRREGSMMAMRTDGTFVGSVSGGCVETAVLEAARTAIDSGEGRLLRFGVADEDSWEVGLACGGEIEVWVERVGPHLPLEAMLAARERGGGATFDLDLETGQWRDAGDAPPGAPGGGVSGGVFHLDVRPPVRVVIVGAVHLAQHLVPMVQAAEYMATVVDARAAFAAEDRFPGADLVRAWPDQALDELKLDDRTAVVLLTHDPKFDDPSLRVALESDAFYVGALGSRRTHAKRVARLREAGVPDELLERIHAPIGLDIGARTPGEIAASIVGEIVQEVRATHGAGARRSAPSPQS